MPSRSLNILLADDEISTVASVTVVLRQSGHIVDTVNDGGVALSLLKKNLDYYHILITDHEMFEVSGLELVTQLRVLKFQGRIVVLSGHLTKELMKSYTALGADRLISKPFDLADLRKAVEELGGGKITDGLSF